MSQVLRALFEEPMYRIAVLRKSIEHLVRSSMVKYEGRSRHVTTPVRLVGGSAEHVRAASSLGTGGRCNRSCRASEVNLCALVTDLLFVRIRQSLAHSNCSIVASIPVAVVVKPKTCKTCRAIRKLTQ